MRSKTHETFRWLAHTKHFAAAFKLLSVPKYNLKNRYANTQAATTAFDYSIDKEDSL